MSSWDYNIAFSRNLGLLAKEDIPKIRAARIALPGMGGVGGIHLLTLVRQGFEKFTIADFDHFELGNFNRQYGAEMASIGKPKVEWMAEAARKINPEVDIRIFPKAIDASSAAEFLMDCSVIIDGIDAFSTQARRDLFRVARERNIWVVTAGPLGFSTAWLSFDPAGMTFDKYFGFKDGQSELEMFARFIAGLAPRRLHMPYMDLAYLDIKRHRGPSSILSCQLCAGVAAAETVKIVTGKGRVKAVPHYQQFDAYRGRFASGRVFWAGSSPWLKLKIKIMLARFAALMREKPA